MNVFLPKRAKSNHALFPWSVPRAISALPPDVRHRNLERLVVEIVRRALSDEGKRLLLIIEDAQWMNPYSMKLLLKARVC